MTETFNEQIQRIKRKIPLAKRADSYLYVFGASSHKYKIKAPVALKEVLQFEEKFSFSLPECYRSFILQVGNGGLAYPNYVHDGSAAGPYYGIFPFGTSLDSMIREWGEETTEQRIIYQFTRECVLFPGMTKEEWKNLREKEENDDDFSVYRGILPIGTQGCTYFSGLILNGEPRGKVVYLDEGRQKPIFPFAKNFLSWYERWLDDIISEDSITDMPVGVALCKGETELELLEEHKNTTDPKDKLDCLCGLVRKKKLTSQTLSYIEALLVDCSEDEKKVCLRLLCKFDYNQAKPYLLELAKTDLLSFFQLSHWYAKDKNQDWLPVIRENIYTINDPETFRYCTYLLREVKKAIANEILTPYLHHSNREMRDQAAYILGSSSIEHKTSKPTKKWWQFWK